ncbi:MAG: GntR family transcriptional regulator [Ilumatobacter sp.]
MTTSLQLDGAQPLTRTEWAHDLLRAAILRGDYGPGDPLVISTLSEEMGVSASPLREALRNLASTGLVELHSHGKARIATVDLHEANEIYELRLLIEPAALERAVHNADDGYRDRVERAWIDLSQAPVPPPSIHANFHRALLSNCDSDWMLKLSTMLADRAGLMISTSVEMQAPDYNSAETHQTLKELAISGTAEAAANELHRHLRGSISAIRRRFATAGSDSVASSTTSRRHDAT